MRKESPYVVRRLRTYTRLLFGLELAMGAGATLLFVGVVRAVGQGHMGDFGSMLMGVDLMLMVVLALCARTAVRGARYWRSELESGARW